MSVVTLKVVNSSVREASLASVPCRSSLSSLLKSDAYLYSERFMYVYVRIYDKDVISIYCTNYFMYIMCVSTSERLLQATEGG